KAPESQLSAQSPTLPVRSRSFSALLLLPPRFSGAAAEEWTRSLLAILRATSAEQTVGYQEGRVCRRSSLRSPAMEEPQEQQQQLRLDLEELTRLRGLAKRPRVASLLSSEIHSVDEQLSKAAPSAAQQAPAAPVPARTAVVTPSSGAASVLNYITLGSFSWDQDNEKLKIYVSLEGVEQEKVDAVFQPMSIDIKFHDVQGKNYRCAIPKLNKVIVPEKCKMVVKPSRVIITLHKASKGNWLDLHFKEDKMSESEAVRLLEGRLVEQAVEMERIRAESQTLREELARVRASRDTGASSSAQHPTRDLATELRKALGRAEVRIWELGEEAQMDNLRLELLRTEGRLLEAGEREGEAKRARAQAVADLEFLKNQLLRRRREQQRKGQPETPARTGSIYASLDDLLSLGDPLVGRGGPQPEALAAARPPLPDRRREREEEELKPNLDKEKDPMAGIMDLMKNMYEEGDDEMKRTIAKAWTDARSGKAADPLKGYR
ncbi:hypothetical protein Taro_021788, partial [Colocasia esculenta]|nr:hypothetical protein [Colocasia esculenta]